MDDIDNEDAGFVRSAIGGASKTVAGLLFLSLDFGFCRKSNNPPVNRPTVLDLERAALRLLRGNDNSAAMSARARVSDMCRRLDIYIGGDASLTEGCFRVSYWLRERAAAYELKDHWETPSDPGRYFTPRMTGQLIEQINPAKEISPLEGLGSALLAIKAMLHADQFARNIASEEILQGFVDKDRKRDALLAEDDWRQLFTVAALLDIALHSSLDPNPNGVFSAEIELNAQPYVPCQKGAEENSAFFPRLDWLKA